VDEQARCCPDCGVRAERPHSWVTTRPGDLPVAGRRTELTWNKRRWRCREAVCPRATFTEALPQIPSRARLTRRLRESAGAAVADRGRTVIQSARDHEISWPIVQAAFAAHAKKALPTVTPQVERLGIDEIRRGKAKFRLTAAGDTWEVTADRWHVGFVDLAGGAELLGQVEGRTAKTVSDWIGRPPSGGQAFGSSPSTCAPSSNPRSGPPCRTRSWSSTAFTSPSSRTTPSPRSAAGSPCNSAAAGAARATGSGSCATD
jgi:transposase